MSTKKLRRVLLRERQGEGRGTDVSVDLVVRENGDLVLEGWDVGAAPQEIFGDSDYEYWLTILSEDKNRVLEELLAEVGGHARASGDQDELLLDLLVERFSTSHTPDGDLKEWLTARGIPSTFSSYA